MTVLKNILKSFSSLADKAPEKEYENLWLQRSKENDDGTYSNQPTSIEVLKSDTTDEFVYNAWARVTEEGLSDMDKFVEEELIPNGMRLLRDTKLLSADSGSIRFMIARNIAS